MLDFVAKKILQEFPKVEFITKHDSVLPTGLLVTDKTNKIGKLMLEEIEKQIGFRPKLKVSQCNNKYFSYTTPLPLCIPNPCNLQINNKIYGSVSTKTKKIDFCKNRKIQR